MHFSRRSAGLGVAVGTIALAATACGSSGSSTTTAAASTSQTAPAGKVTIVLTNDSAIQHSIAIKAPGDVPGQVVSQGQMSTTTATLKAGTYQYYCTVPGHAQSGMVGTLTVTG